eukprot:TRINITY_DN51427_c0_g1_i1.p1 TRINITY_DN51427_c0_g1~~TRINITY_DN51427_c0_g1_i1.p1  ORF type:complete len:212 (+),score=46.50 TRINITY_DN51427_c0_g1_i1:68-637(+)
MTFLRSNQQVGRFSMGKDRRKHVHRQLDGCRVDCTHQTPAGSVLIVTKRRSAFDAAKAKQNQALAWLSKLKVPGEVPTCQPAMCQSSLPATQLERGQSSQSLPDTLVQDLENLLEEEGSEMPVGAGPSRVQHSLEGDLERLLDEPPVAEAATVAAVEIMEDAAAAPAQATSTCKPEPEERARKIARVTL